MEVSGKDSARSQWRAHKAKRGGPHRQFQGRRQQEGPAADLEDNFDRYYEEDEEAAGDPGVPVRKSKGGDLAKLLAEADHENLGYRPRGFLAEEDGEALPAFSAEAAQALSTDFQGLEACLSQLPLHEVLGVEASLFQNEAPLAATSTSTSQQKQAAHRTTVPAHWPATRPDPPKPYPGAPLHTAAQSSSGILPKAAGQATVRDTHGAREPKTPLREEIEPRPGSGRQQGNAPCATQKREGNERPAVARRREGTKPSAVRQNGDEAQLSEQLQPSRTEAGNNPHRVAGGGDAVDALLDMLLAGDDADVAPAKPPPVRNPRPGGTLGSGSGTDAKGLPHTRNPNPGGTVGRVGGSSSTSGKGMAQTRAAAFGAAPLIWPDVHQGVSRGRPLAQQGSSGEGVSQRDSVGQAGNLGVGPRSGVVAQMHSPGQGGAQVGSRGQGVPRVGSIGQGVAQENSEGQTVGPSQVLKKTAEEELLDWLDD